jgi:diketogulonate reductase-like aldo/keto reductase
LRLERIDLLQLHTLDPTVPIEESVGAMVELQDEGKVRMIGVLNVGVEELERARAVGEIVSVQNPYNLCDRASEDVLAVCDRAGIAFLPWFPIGAGALAGASELQAVASAHGATAAQVAIAWLLQRSPVMLPIPGTSSIPHLEANMAAAGLRLSAEEVRRLSKGGGTCRRPTNSICRSSPPRRDGHCSAPATRNAACEGQTPASLRGSCPCGWSRSRTDVQGAIQPDSQHRHDVRPTARMPVASQ